MQNLSISRAKSLPKKSVHIYAVQEIGEKGKLLSSKPPKSITSALTTLGFTGKSDTFTTFVNPENHDQLVAFVGIGKNPEANNFRNAAAITARNLSTHSSLSIDCGPLTEEQIQALFEGLLLGAYSFDSYKTDAAKNKIQSVSVLAAPIKDDLALSQAITIAEAVHIVKDLVNTPPNDLYPASFVDKAQKILDPKSVSVAVWDEKKLLKEGFGGILGVGQGSSRPPRLMRIHYSPKKSNFHLSLVGKGITFDTGGLSLKTGAGMIGMKYDMTGAATALAVINAVSSLRLPITLTAWLCLAENMPSGTAIRPNDVLSIYGGKTVEVLNTDAEGRLVLADGLVKASEEQPDLLIDIATLTGAATTALGTRYTGAMGDPQEISHLVELGNSVGEHFWHMPLPEEIRSYLNSDIADLANVKPANTAGGMLVGATFLSEFVGKKGKSKDGEKLPWIHLDIANTANNAGSPFGATSSGPTGVAVRTLIALALKRSQA